VNKDNMDGHEVITKKPVPSAPEFDAAKYLSEIDGLDLSGAQKIELLQTLFSIMETFVHLGFDVGAVDVCGQVFQDFNKAANSTLEGVESAYASAMENNEADIGGV